MRITKRTLEGSWVIHALANSYVDCLESKVKSCKVKYGSYILKYL